MPTRFGHPDYSAIENIAFLVSGKSPEMVVATRVHPVMIRMPVNDLCFIDSITKLAGHSRSQKCVMLLNAAVDNVQDKLDGDVLKKMNDLISDILKELNPAAETDYE
jgi:hypothetical protein